MSEAQTRPCADSYEAWLQGIPIYMCKNIYGIHMVLGNEEKLFKALGNYR
jgi:hypothetical protein